MTPPPDFRVRLVDWRETSPVLSRIRTTVFVGEQKVPPEIEIDGRVLTTWEKYWPIPFNLSRVLRIH